MIDSLSIRDFILFHKSIRQSLAYTPVSRRVDVRQAAKRKNAESLSQHDKNMYRPHLMG
jgi:hypothetical protein